MSRTAKILLLVMLVVFTLACNAIDQRVNQVQDAAKTVEAIGTAIPIETLQALPSALPQETLQAVASEMPDFNSMFNPQGTPVSEWNGIPVMPQASAGQEADANNYSFKFTGTTQEAVDFYNAEMVKLGWTSMFSMPGNNNGAVLAFQKDSTVLTITIVTTDADTVVVLTKA
ncbi:MAG: hypothetical protein QM730_19485 [Anaerolineales bacterium]